LPILWDYLYWKGSDNPMQLTAFRLEFKDLKWKDIRVEI
jgi:hypothetical protein